MKNTLVISAFPCSGKSHFTQLTKTQSEYHNKYPVVLDSDSSLFHWIVDSQGNKVENPDFIQNYIAHIKENIGKADIIFVSSHYEVCKAMREANIDYILVYPVLELKAEFIGRAYLRGSSDSFIKNIKDNWENWHHSTYENEKNNVEKVFWLTTEFPYISDIVKLLEWKSRIDKEEENF